MPHPRARLVALSVGLGVVTIVALVVATHTSDTEPEVARPAQPQPPPRQPQPLPRPATATPPPDAAAPDAPPPAPGSNAPEALWPTAGSGDLAALVPRGPFTTLDELCTARHKSADDCKITTQDVESGPFPQVATVEIFEPPPESSPASGTGTEYVAAMSKAGWYVMPFAVLTMLNESGFYITPKPAGDALVIEYRKGEGNRWDNDTEVGITVCTPVRDASMVCTPQIPERKRTDVMNGPTDPGPKATIALACVASYADGAVTVAPMRKPATTDDDDPTDWDAGAAARCKHLPYAGRHRIAVSPR